MSNVKVRRDGYYLARYWKEESLCIIEIKGGDIIYGADDWSLTVENFHWIADEPLDLESIRLLMMNGGLENAVEVVNKDSSKTSSVLSL